MEVKQFADGLFVDEELTALPAILKVLSYNSDKDYSEIYVTIHEGKFHQVKRMFTAIGSEVLFLKRITFGALSLDESLKTGEYRTLTKEEISLLQQNQIKR
jgi:16S rRNA pseudouridine516 synthase